MTDQNQSATKPSIVVLISGNGSNLQAIIDAVSDGSLSARIDLVVSNRSNAYGLERARIAGIPTLVRTLKAHRDSGKSRVDYDIDLAADIKSHLANAATPAPSGAPDLIVLAGFMHILSPDFLACFSDGRVINLHPALPGAFDGAHAIDRAFASYKAGEIAHTGVMVHKVIPEVDRGEVILQRIVPIHATDTLETLEQRIHAVEHVLLVEGIRVMLGQSAQNSAPSS